MKTILITGGAGFIGSHLAEKLHESGQKVVCLDDLYTGSLENLKNLVNSRRFEFVHHDVRTPFDIPADEIYNLACPASPVHYSRDPVRTVVTNISGAIHALENGRQHGSKILQASTSEVYGDPLVSPQAESYRGEVNCIGPRACYDEGKRCAETLFMDYKREHGLPVKVARIFNTFGPRTQANDGRVVSNFILQALRGEPLTIYGNGEQTRSFCYVTDLVEGLVRLMATSDDFTGPVNLGNPQEITIVELAEVIIRITGSKSKIIFLAAVEDDPRQRCPDITLAAERLGWIPSVDWKEGITTTVAYFRKRLAGSLLQGVLRP